MVDILGKLRAWPYESSVGTLVYNYIAYSKSPGTTEALRWSGLKSTIDYTVEMTPHKDSITTWGPSPLLIVSYAVSGSGPMISIGYSNLCWVGANENVISVDHSMTHNEVVWSGVALETSLWHNLMQVQGVCSVIRLSCYSKNYTIAVMAVSKLVPKWLQNPALYDDTNIGVVLPFSSPVPIQGEQYFQAARLQVVLEVLQKWCSSAPNQL